MRKSVTMLVFYLIGWDATSVGWIFPIEVQSVEIVFFNEVHYGVDKDGSFCRTRHHLKNINFPFS
jgi:hypothetical protein